MARLREMLPAHQPGSLIAFEVLQVAFVSWQLVASRSAALVGSIVTLSITYLIARKNVYAWRVANWLLVVLLLFGVPFYVFAVHDHSNRGIWLGCFIYLAVSLVLSLVPTTREWFNGDEVSASTPP